MFHRRLALLWCLCAAIVLVLAVQMSKLSLAEGALRRAAAEERLDLVTWLPTFRGRILDRQGRELAVDRPSHDVAVEYEVIIGEWALRQASRAARSENGSRWADMTAAERDAAKSAHLAEFTRRTDGLWAAIMEIGGIDRAELDRRLDAIKHEVERTAAIVWDRQLKEEIRMERAAADGTGFRPRPIREQRQAHVLLPRVPDATAFALRREIAARELPGVEVRDSSRRAYPWRDADVTVDRSSLPAPLRADDQLTIRVTGVADHILGSMRDEIWASDEERRPFQDPVTGAIDLGGYRLGDDVGARGVERAFEDHLRGVRGVAHKRLDTGAEERTPHVPGRDLRLTIDVALQAQVQAFLSPELGLARVHQYQAGWHPGGVPRPTELPEGTPLDGAAVVLAVQTGEILALVSMPTVAMAAAAPPPCPAPQTPWINRPVEAVYPPGSIMKPLVLLAALTEGAQGADDPIHCTGHFLPQRTDILRCWIYRPPAYNTHGDLSAAEALARSCNIYFYTIGERLGVERLAGWMRRFSIGEPFDVGLLETAPGPGGATVRRGEAGGSIPGPEDIARLDAAGELRFTGTILGIGQGPVTWTPLHAAHAYATLARRGAARRPAIVSDRPGDGTTSGEGTRDLDLDDGVVATILEGLRRSVAEPYGTSNHITYSDGTTEPIINAEGVVVWAKTGTAQATPRSFDLDCDGDEDVALKDPSHAWFVGLAGDAADARPEYAIAVIVEYGGSGGRVSGPIANQIIRALQRLGYLGRPAA